MATLFLCFFCRTNDKKCRKNVFAENIDVREQHTSMKTLRTYLLIQRIFAKFLQKVILFCRKRLTIWCVSVIIICVARATGTTQYADVAELADALDSGSSSLKRVWVQIPSSAPKSSNVCSGIFCFSDLFGMTSIDLHSAGGSRFSAIDTATAPVLHWNRGCTILHQLYAMKSGRGLPSLSHW